MSTFWGFWVRNPLFAAAGLAMLAAALNVWDWSLGLSFATVAVLMGDAAWHLSSKARRRSERKAVEREAAASKARLLELTNHDLAEHETAA